ncbi:MAG TPA: cytochrome c-type biogenesis protein [Burkholderiales bacterium]|jgi:cytochrome c-type biogenesis protein CcmH|nr:cytochrome c-type biogenesis protein [Burkholderiales bacterium]
MIAVLLMVLALPVYADEAAPAAQDPVLEQRMMRLTAELRCLVCQNQSLADSHADLAIDLKNQVRSQMLAGKSDAEIREFMVARYGDFVLYKPPLKSTTALLWAGPFMLLAAGGLALGFYLRRRRERLTESELTPEQHALAEALLRAGREGESR